MPDRLDNTDADDPTDQPNADGNEPDNGADPPADGKPATGDTDGQDDDTDTDTDGDGTDWKARSRTWEDRAKANRTAAEKAAADRDNANATLDAVRNAFGLDDDKDDPQTVAEKATAAAAEKDAELRALRIERAAEKVGRRAGADVDALLDSRGFAAKVGNLDPAVDTFDTDLRSIIDKALDDNPRLKAAQSTAPPPSSVDMTGGGENGNNSPNPDDIDAIRKARSQRRTG